MAPIKYDFDALLVDTDECIEFPGSRSKRGYGQIVRKIDGVAYFRAHRYAYALTVGQIPDGLVLDHLCRNPPCINPRHLEPVSQQVNVIRGTGVGARYAGRTECKNGHPFTDDTPIRTDGGRRCKVCEREIELRRQPRRRLRHLRSSELV